MFNVKRIGSTVEITQIPRKVSIDVFKEIAAQTEANECLICFSKDRDNYEVIIRHDNDNMAGAVAWLALEALEPVTGDADISTLGKRIGVMRVKQHTSAQELEHAIGAPKGSIFRWETGETIPSWLDLSALASVLKCDPEWLLDGPRLGAYNFLRYEVVGSKIPQEMLIKLQGGVTDSAQEELPNQEG